jgi:SAM-dependent methyltransferase
MSKPLSRDKPCKVCESNAGYRRIFNQLDQCHSCGFITFHDFDAVELLDIYADDYFTGSEYPDYLGQQDALRRSMQRHLKQISRYHPKRDSLLEVGCAYGLFLDEAKAYFKNIAGVDICENPVSYARKELGLNAQCRDFLDIDFGAQRFDVVCLWDTVEHLSAPEAYLEKTAGLLNEAGMLFLTTGDIGSFNARLRGKNWRQIHPPSHLQYFSRRTMTHLLDRLGYEVIGIETASYYHTIFNVLASLRMRGGTGGSIASTTLALLGERFARRLGLWINLGDIMFVAARLKTQ